MSKALIPLLNSLITLTPDEIAKRLNGRGWVRGKDMTAEQLAAMMGKAVMLCIHTARRNHRACYLWGPREYTFNWDLIEVNRSLADYQFILKENFQDGVLPEPHPAS